MIESVDMRRIRRLAAVALFAAVGAAIASLPREVLPWPWLAALVAPAAILGLQKTPPRRPFLRALLATIMQLAACVLAYQYVGSIARPAALAGTILPPMVFVTVRRQDVDATLGLFLSLCVLLVGTILGTTELPVLGIYVIAAAVQLRCEARLGALRDSAPMIRRRPTSPLAPTLSGIGLGALCALAAFAVDRSLGALPSLGNEPEQVASPSGPAPRSVGLPDSFVLDGGGELLELQGERLVDVTSGDGQPLTPGLYLRSGLFERPGLQSWQVGHLDSETRDTSRREWRIRQSTSNVPIRRLELVRTAAARNRVFTPPGLCSIYGLTQLLADPAREWYREPENLAQGNVYELSYQDLPLSNRLKIDPRWKRQQLTSVPDGDLSLFQQLLDTWQPDGTPLEKARIIADGLQERCSYVRREPTGPHREVLLNFLHGEKIGFCMHFASATAILLRMSGVPCRIGVGLYGGDAGARPESRSYGSQHAHAWVEIPLSRYGWVVFDPTPPAERGIRGELTRAAQEGDDPSGADDGADEDVSLIEQLSDLVVAVFSSPWPWIVLIVLLVVPLRRTERRERAPVVHRAARPARRWLMQILRVLANNGRPRMHGMTIEQHQLALDRNDALPDDLRAAFRAYQEVRFGGRSWNDDYEHRMRRGLAAARELPQPGN